MKKSRLLMLAWIVIFSTINSQDTESDSLEQAVREKWVGKTAPNWSLKSANGHYEFLQNWTVPQGKQLRKPSIQPDRHVVVVVFYGSWCPPCVKQLDPLEEVHQKYKNEKIKFFVVDNTELARKLYSDSEWEGFKNAHPTKELFQEKGITMSILEEKNHSVFRKHKINSIPRIFVIDKFQTIQEVFMGFTFEESDEFEEQLSKAIGKVLVEN